MKQFGYLMVLGLLFWVGFGWGGARAAAPPAFTPELISCIEDVLGEERFQNLLAGGAEGNYLEPTEAEKVKVEACIQEHQPELIGPTGAEEIDDGGGTSGDFGLKSELRDCLRRSIPDFDEMVARAERGELSEPTASQRTAAEACFREHGEPEFVGHSGDRSGSSSGPADDGGDSGEMYQCLSDLFGAERFAAMKSGRTQPTPEEMRRAEETCLSQHGSRFWPPTSGPSGPGGEGRSHGMSDEQRDCVAGVVGQDRFDQMMSGTRFPSETEKRQMIEECFGSEHAGASGVYVQPGSEDDVAEYHSADLPDYLKDCLKEVFGSDAVSQMESGSLQPSEEQMAAMNSCTQSHYSGKSDRDGRYPDYRSEDPSTYPNPDGFSPSYSPASATSDSPTHSTEYPTYPSSDPAAYSSSPSSSVSYDYQKIEDCKKDALRDNYDAYQRGQYYPTQDEYNRMAACYR